MHRRFTNVSHGGNAMFTVDEVKAAIDRVGLDLKNEGISLEAVLAGMNVELEHGTRFPDLNVTGDDPVATAKIALAHLREFPDYYERLARMEAEADAARAVMDEPGLGIV
jgi:hypothetical protein